MDVLPYILTEDHIKELTDEHLMMLADCSPERIYKHIVAYLENENADRKCRERIYEAYRGLIEEKEYFKDERTIESADKVKNLSYTDLSNYMTDEELLSIKEAILYITNNKNSVPYIPPVTNDIVKVFKEELKAYTKKYPALTHAKSFYNIFSKNSSLFKDARSQRSKGTIVKKVVKNPDNYEIIVKGIDFMLEARRSGTTVKSWRYI